MWAPWLVSQLLDCHALCMRKLCDLFYESQLSVVEGPLFKASEILIFCMLGIVSATELFNDPETKPGNCCEATGQAGISLGPQSMFLKLSLGEQFWMKDSFNNFISDPFLPMKLLF